MCHRVFDHQDVDTNMLVERYMQIVCVCVCVCTFYVVCATGVYM